MPAISFTYIQEGRGLYQVRGNSKFTWLDSGRDRD